MKVAIVNYNAGNICSVVNALKRLDVVPELTDSAEKLMNADCVLFPGQGEAKSTMRYLHEHGLDEVIKNLKQPVLGICIGQQLMCKHSEEGDVDCLGIFDVEVKRFVPQVKADKVPHMGWNTLEHTKGALYKDVQEGEFVYFVHSFYVPVNQFTIATTTYIQPFSASMHKDNFYATQFHPEKSGDVGERILRNFLDLTR